MIGAETGWMLAASTAGHLYWITSRAAGIAALALASASVGLGVAMGGRLVRGRVPDLRVAHEALSLGTMAALAVHGLALVGDAFIGMNLADVSVPFASSYQTFWVTLGVVGGWLLVLLGLSYYFRARIGAERWKRLHRWTLLAWLLGVVHALGVGTDAGAAWFLLSVGAVALPAAAMVALRFSGTSQVRFTSGS
jgi:sulfoxide reductase heme-binding subunit YedZ